MKKTGIAPYLIAAFVALSGVVACCAPWGAVAYVVRHWMVSGTSLLDPSLNLGEWKGDEPLTPEKAAEAIDLIVEGDPRGWMMNVRLSTTDAAIVAPIALAKLREQLAEGNRDADALRMLANQIARDLPPDALPVLMEGAKAIRLQAENDCFDSALASTGDDEAIRMVLERTLKRGDEMYLWMISSGLETAIEKERLKPETRAYVAEQMATLHQVTDAAGADRALSTDATDLWVKLDPAAAVNRLTLPPFWKAENESIVRIVYTVSQTRLPVPNDRLQALGGELWKLPADEYRRPSGIIQVATMLAWQEDPSADRLIKAMESDEKLKSGVAKARAAQMGIWDPEGLARRKAKEAADPASIPEPYRELIAFRDFLVLMEDGSYSYYFSDEGGNNWKADLARLETFGMRKAFEEMERAVAFFGTAPGPAATPEERKAQIEKLSKQDRETFESLGASFWDADVLTPEFTFAMQHADLFRERP